MRQTQWLTNMKVKVNDLIYFERSSARYTPISDLRHCLIFRKSRARIHEYVGLAVGRAKARQNMPPDLSPLETQVLQSSTAGAIIPRRTWTMKDPRRTGYLKYKAEFQSVEVSIPIILAAVLVSHTYLCERP